MKRCLLLASLLLASGPAHAKFWIDQDAMTDEKRAIATVGHQDGAVRRARPPAVAAGHRLSRTRPRSFCQILRAHGRGGVLLAKVRGRAASLDAPVRAALPSTHS
jgi:hypothetical protein